VDGADSFPLCFSCFCCNISLCGERFVAFVVAGATGASLVKAIRETQTPWEKDPDPRKSAKGLPVVHLQQICIFLCLCVECVNLNYIVIGNGRDLA
jgi:hypothetical protein